MNVLHDLFERMQCDEETGKQIREQAYAIVEKYFADRCVVVERKLQKLCRIPGTDDCLLQFG